MIETSINKSQIVTIELCEDVVYRIGNGDIYYKPYKKGFLGIGKQREGFYYCFMRERFLYEVGKIPSFLFIKENVLYEHPKVIIHLSDTSKEVKRFADIEAAKLFVSEIHSKYDFQII